MSRRLPLRFLALVSAATVLACADSATPTGTTAPATSSDAPAAPATSAAPAPRTPGAPGDLHPALEHLARRMARALRDSAFRAYVKASLDSSSFAEHKVEVSRFLAASGGRAARELARLNGEPEAAASADPTAGAGPSLEMYFPVPAHRDAWHGGADLLVATAVADGEAPVAYDLMGRRRVLSPAAPPATPVLAVEPAETRFDRPSRRDLARATCTTDCSGGGGGGGSVVIPGLYMSASHLTQTFESWLKGSPEIEILVLGQKATTDSLTKYQCIGERAPGSYYFDQDGLDWSGNVLLFSQTQLDAFRQQHPGQAVRLFFMEDDDTSCEIRNNPLNLQKLIGDVDAATRGLSGGKDTTAALSVGVIGKIYKYANVVQHLYSIAASILNSNDDLIGNAVEDATVGASYPGYNWVLKAENGTTNGWINVQMR